MNDCQGEISLQKYRRGIYGATDRELDVEPLRSLLVVVVPSLYDATGTIQDYPRYDANPPLGRSLERMFDDACRRHIIQMSDAGIQFLLLRTVSLPVDSHPAMSLVQKLRGDRPLPRDLIGRPYGADH